MFLGKFKDIVWALIIMKTFFTFSNIFDLKNWIDIMFLFLKQARIQKLFKGVGRLSRKLAESVFLFCFCGVFLGTRIWGRLEMLRTKNW